MKKNGANVIKWYTRHRIKKREEIANEECERVLIYASISAVYTHLHHKLHLS